MKSKYYQMAINEEKKKLMYTYMAILLLGSGTKVTFPPSL